MTSLDDFSFGKINNKEIQGIFLKFGWLAACFQSVEVLSNCLVFLNLCEHEND